MTDLNDLRSRVERLEAGRVTMLHVCFAIFMFALIDSIADACRGNRPAQLKRRIEALESAQSRPAPEQPQ